MCKIFFLLFVKWKKLEFSTSKGVLINVDFLFWKSHFSFLFQQKQPCLFMSSHSLFLCFSNNLWLSAPETTIKYYRTPTYIHQITEMFQPERTSPSPRKQSNLLTELPFITFPPTFQMPFYDSKFIPRPSVQFLHPPSPPPRLKLALPSLYDMTVWLICYYHQGTFKGNLLLNPVPIPWGAGARSFYSITVIAPLLKEAFQQCL